MSIQSSSELLSDNENLNVWQDSLAFLKAYHGLPEGNDLIINPACARVKKISVYVPWEGIEMMQKVDQLLKPLIDFQGDLILRNMQGRLTPEEKAYYDAWVKNLEENSTGDEENDEE